MAAANELARSALQKIKEESSNLGLWLEMKEVTAGILAKTSEDCSDFFSMTVYRVAQCVCQSAPVFLPLLCDECCLFRLRRMRAKMVESPLPRPANRDNIVMYCSGWVLRAVRRNCWRRGGIKHQYKQDRYTCLMDFFVEGGKHAQSISDPAKRSWIDKKDRGEIQDGKKSGLMVPSREAATFFEGLDAVIFDFECRSGLRASMTFDAVMVKVYDNLCILDSWHALTSSLESEEHQTAFLEFVVQLYRRFLGHAIGERVIRLSSRFWWQGTSVMRS